MPERQRHRPHAARQIGAPVDRDDARRVCKRRDVGEQRRLDVLTGDEDVDERDRSRRFDEVFPLDDEQLELVSPAPVVELADELEPLVVAGGDQRNVIRPARRCRARTSPARRLP
jgi:hypothetical protein